MEPLFEPIDPPRGSDPAPGDHTEHFLPTEFSRGPWSDQALHGGPVAALMVRALQALDTPVDMRLVRFTLELLRPVPLVPLWLSASVIRPGAKVGMLEATLGRAEDAKVVAVARAQRIRTKDVDFAEATDGTPDVSPDAVETTDLARVTPIAKPYRAYHNAAVEHRFVRGMFGEPGPSFDWMRLVSPVVPGEEPTGWQRAAAAADFANGISSVVAFDGSTMFINPDLTVNLWREPAGEWIGLDAVTRTTDDGIGMSDSTIWDEQGKVGRGTQSLLLDRA